MTLETTWEYVWGEPESEALEGQGDTFGDDTL